MTRRARWWAVSPVRHPVHLLDQRGVLPARCGHLLPIVVYQYDQPPPGPPRERCRQISLRTSPPKNPGRPPVEPAALMVPAAGRSQYCGWGAGINAMENVPQ